MKHSQPIHLVFPSMGQLWAFAKTLNVDSMEISSITTTLTCCCSDADVQRAITQFGAEVKLMLHNTNK